MCAGEFLESYSDQENEWDCVLTCFFIDTAPVIIEYIDVIYKILKPGGVWINLGPLLYHWQVELNALNHLQSTEDITAEEMDERYAQSLELSFEEIQDIMTKVGFSIKEVERFCSPYTDNVFDLKRMRDVQMFNDDNFVPRGPFCCTEMMKLFVFFRINKQTMETNRDSHHAIPLLPVVEHQGR